MRRARQFVFLCLVLLTASYALALGLHTRLAAPPFLVVNGVVLSAADFCGDHDAGKATGHPDCPLCRLPVADLSPGMPNTLARACAGRAVVFPVPAEWPVTHRHWATADPRAPPIV